MVSFTLLRDPVERAISDIYHHQNDLVRYPQMFTPEYNEAMRPWVKADLRTCLDIPAFVRLIDNRQTRELAVRRDFRPWLKDGSAREWLLSPNEAPALSEESNLEVMLEDAKRNLDRLTITGITEKFPDFIQLLCDTTGLPQPSVIPEKNIGVQKKSIDHQAYRKATPPDLLERVAELNRYDLELYAYASGLFQQQCAGRQDRTSRVWSYSPRWHQSRAKRSCQFLIGRFRRNFGPKPRPRLEVV
jgi:hypothetical protein